MVSKYWPVRNLKWHDRLLWQPHLRLVVVTKEISHVPIDLPVEDKQTGKRFFQRMELNRIGTIAGILSEHGKPSKCGGQHKRQTTKFRKILILVSSFKIRSPHGCLMDLEPTSVQSQLLNRSQREGSRPCNATTAHDAIMPPLRRLTRNLP